VTTREGQAGSADSAAAADLSRERIEAQAHELLAQLTLEEKVEIMDGDVGFWPGLSQARARRCCACGPSDTVKLA
jgi:hypothetical protein